MEPSTPVLEYRVADEEDLEQEYDAECSWLAREYDAEMSAEIPAAAPRPAEDSGAVDEELAAFLKDEEIAAFLQDCEGEEATAEAAADDQSVEETAEAVTTSEQVAAVEEPATEVEGAETPSCKRRRTGEKGEVAFRRLKSQVFREDTIEAATCTTESACQLDKPASATPVMAARLLAPLHPASAAPEMAARLLAPLKRAYSWLQLTWTDRKGCVPQAAPAATEITTKQQLQEQSQQKQAAAYGPYGA